MKKVLLVCFGAFLLTSNNVSAQAVEEGNVIVDLYYGFPNWYTSIFRTTYANSGSEVNLKVGGIGPLGGRFEYMVADKIGLGLDIGYSNSSVTYAEETVEYDPNTGQSYPVTYDYDFKTSRLGALVTFNFHFVDSDQLDAYGVVGAGYANRTFTFDSNDPNYVSSSVTGIIPVGFKLGVGMRYFFTDNIGLNLALGVGQGGLINGGLSAKF